jgi:hypothetical protein
MAFTVDYNHYDVAKIPVNLIAVLELMAPCL